MSESSPQETLSDVVARRIVRFRKRQNMTRDQLAARCAELGFPALTGPAMANIETGRRLPDGKRRRDVTVDELMVIAEALHVAPALLLFPVGDEPYVPLMPGVLVPPWDAAKWMAGEIYLADAVTESWTVPLYLHRQHDRLFGDLAELLADALFSQPPLEGPEASAARRAHIEMRLRTLRGEMVRHGLTPPELPADLAYIDEKKHRYLTPAEAEARIAAGEQLRVVDHARPGQGKAMKPGDAERLAEAIERGRRFVDDFDREHTQE